MPKPESVLENKMYTILLDFEINMGYLILAGRLDQVLTRKMTCDMGDSDFSLGALENA